MRDRLELVLDMLQRIRLAIDDGLQDANQRVRATGCLGVAATQGIHEVIEYPACREPYCDQPLRRQHKADGNRARLGLRMTDQWHGEVQRAVMCRQPAGTLYLVDGVLSRDRQAGLSRNLSGFRLCRLQQIDP